MNSQILVSCGEEPLTIDLDNTILFFDSSPCDNNLNISTQGESIEIEGVIDLNTKKSSIVIKGIKDYSINIKPLNTATLENPLYTSFPDGEIVLYRATKDPRKKVLPDETSTRLRTTQREGKVDSGDIKEEITVNDSVFVYPNPVEAELTIQLEEAILSYNIINYFGLTFLEGASLTNNIISVRTLPTGQYYIRLETQDQIIIVPFNKN